MMTVMLRFIALWSMVSAVLNIVSLSWISQIVGAIGLLAAVLAAYCAAEG
jgi:hypothetical protein